jgi:hypothetical protein
VPDTLNSVTEGSVMSRVVSPDTWTVPATGDVSRGTIGGSPFGMNLTLRSYVPLELL